MHEQRLQQPLHEVERVTHAGEAGKSRKVALVTLVTLVPKTHKLPTSCSTVTDLLNDPVFAGREVVFGCVDEGNPEVEEQVDDQRARVLRQEDLPQRPESVRI